MILELINSIFSKAYAADQLVPIENSVTLEQIFSNLVTKVILPIVAAASLGFIIYGGLLFMTSGGDSEKVKRARGTLLWAIIGVAVVALSYALVVLLNGQILKILS